MSAGPFQGVKRPRRGVDHPPHLAPRLRKEMICASTSFVAGCKVNFTFTSFYYSTFLLYLFYNLSVLSVLLSLPFYFLLPFSITTSVTTPYYEGWNFNSANYLFTTDTK